jgi:hypothetical protein
MDSTYFLRGVVEDFIAGNGVEASAKFFGAEEGTIKQWIARSKTPSLQAVEKVFDLAKLLNKTQQAEWEGRKLAILCPAYKTIHPYTMFSLLGMWDRSKMGFILRMGDAFIAHARNALVKDFLATGLEWSFWADDDVIYPMGNGTWFNAVTGLNLRPELAANHTLNRLLSHNKTVVGGLYFGRARDGKPMFSEGANDPGVAADTRRNPGPLKLTKWVGTGCLLVHRSVYTSIVQQFPHLDGHWFTSGEHDLVWAMERAKAEVVNGTREEARIILEEALQKARLNSPMGAGEDVQFCLRAAQAGHQVFVDTGLVCAHVGNTAFGPMNTGGL